MEGVKSEGQDSITGKNSFSELSGVRRTSSWLLLVGLWK